VTDEEESEEIHSLWVKGKIRTKGKFLGGNVERGPR
jgi:hypothetical protein